jgi:hypothetical protein
LLELTVSACTVRRAQVIPGNLAWPGYARVSPAALFIAVLTAAALSIDAYVHIDDAGLYEGVSTSFISQATIFRLQAAAAIVLAVAVVLWPRAWTFALAALVAALAVGAVFPYTYLNVGRLGVLPNMYEPTWSLPGKRMSAGAEIAATILALAGIAVALRRRRS